ncbi:MAG TPA: hypothetical protein ENN99_03185, partial [Chloroflexi bacterium]|nr:hypothetical protein [Chloroflexota bacterium]
MKSKANYMLNLFVVLSMVLAAWPTTVLAAAPLAAEVTAPAAKLMAEPSAGEPMAQGPAVHLQDSKPPVMTTGSDEFAIGVYGFHFDPLDGVPSIPTELRAVDSADPGLHLVQFTGPTNDRWLNELRAAGLKPLQYYAHYAYLVWGTPPQVERVDSESYVRWSGAFHPAYKLNPLLDQFDGLIENVAVTFYNDGDIGATLKALGGLGKVIQYWAAQPDEAFYTAILALNASRLTEAATIPTVWAVEYASPEPGLDDENANQIVAGNTPGGMPVAGYYDWLQSKGVTGYGVTWADVDTGLNSAHPDITGDPAMYPSGIGGTRVVAYVTYPGAPAANTDPDGHGSHTAGAIFGDGRYGVHQIDPTASQDPNGMFWGTGMAPSSTLVVQNALYGTSWPPAGGWNILSRDSVVNGAVGSSNSWYTGQYDNSYTAACREHDMMVRDANFETPAIAEPIIYVFSAGNGGPGAGTLSEPHAAKNPIIVGASSNYPRSLASIDDLAGFSSRGPTADNRFNPQVVAPGQWTTSLVGDGGASCYGVYPPGSAANYYHYCSGTSMSCPIIAGTSALIVDWWQQDYGLVPSPAMVKALLVNGADDMAGGNDGGGGTLENVPNFDVGWGRANADRTIRPDVPTLYEDQQTIFGSSGEVWQQTFVVADPSEPVKISLAWTDAPGAIGANPALVNDLNLVVTSGADTYLGNVFAGGWSATGGAADALNNLENVFLPPGTFGSINVAVHAFNIAGDGVPYNSDDTDQDFALVCYNCLQGPVGWLEGTVYDDDSMDGVVGAGVQAQGLVPGQAGGTTSGAAGYYQMALLTDTYTVTASFYGYYGAEISGVSVVSGTTTTLDIPLTSVPWHVVEGTVTDATTGWPLYASIEIADYPYGTIWTDPVSGYYSLTLPAGMIHTFQVEAWVAGYDPAHRDVVVTGDRTEDFALDPSPACIAPGYAIEGGLLERFETGDVPAGWTVVDNVGNGQVWAFDDPGGNGNQTGGSGGFAVVDSDAYGSSGFQDTELRSPSLDFSGETSVILEFDTDYYTYTGADYADVDVSTDGGVSWTNVWRKHGANYRGPAHETIDISALAAGQPDVMVRFYYYNAAWEWWWQVDNVSLGNPVCVAPTDGGLIVGNVYDENTGDPLVGAEIVNDAGYATESQPTPADDAVDDGFYTLFAPSGAQV